MEPDFRIHVRRAVTAKGSQERLAEASGVTQQQISYLLNEAKSISGPMALKIANATVGTKDPVSIQDLNPEFAELMALAQPKPEQAEAAQ